MDHLKKLLPCLSDAPLTSSELESETPSDVSPPPSTLAIEDAQAVEGVQDVVVFPNGNFEIPNSFEIPSKIGPVECELFLEKILGFQEAYEVGQGTTDSVAIHVKPPNYMNSNVGSFVVKAFWFNEANETQCDHRSAKFQNESTIFALCSEHKNVLQYYGSFKLLFDEKESHFIATTAMDISKAIIGQRRLMGCILMHKFTCTFVDYLKNSGLEQTDGPNTEALFYQIGSALSFMHRRRMCHHDVTENNIGLSRIVDGIPQLLLFDFGGSEFHENEFGPAQEHSAQLCQVLKTSTH